MNRLGGDVIRKIAHLLEEGDDVDVFHLALTCKSIHRHLKPDLARLIRIHTLSEHDTLCRLERAIKAARIKKRALVSQTIADMLPRNYQVEDVCIKCGDWMFAGYSVLDDNSIDVYHCKHTFYVLAMRLDGSINWERTRAECKRSGPVMLSLNKITKGMNLDDVFLYGYETFKDVFAPILAIYPSWRKVSKFFG
jgi:hypothetical protein